MFTVVSTENDRPAEVGFACETDAGAQRLESYFADLVAACESAGQALDIERERDRLCGLLAEVEAGTCEWSDVHEEWPWPTG